MVSPQKTVGYQPQALPGVDTQDPPILFHYEGEQTAVLESDITDHFVEDNTSIQDQWSLHPDQITTQGFIGELNDVPPIALASQLALAQKLTVLGAYTPQLSITALNAYNEALFLYQQALTAAAAYTQARATINGTGLTESVISSSGLSTQPNQTQQQIYFQKFYEYRQSRTLFTIQTPWAVWTNMAIKTLRAIQDAESTMVTDFEVTFKQIRFAENITINTNQTQGRLQDQSASSTNLGTSQPPLATQTLATQIAQVA